MVIPKVVKRKEVLIVGVVLLIIIALLPALYFYQKYQAAQLQITNPTEAAKRQAAETVAQVAKLMMLPTGETPTVAVIQDVTKLKGQAFYTNAQNGDAVLIYTAAKEAIIYRPSIQKIIEVAPVNIGSTPTSTEAGATTPAASFSVVLRNGTSTIGATQKIQNEIQAKAANLTIADRDTAKIKTVTKTIIIDISGDKSSIASQIASTLGISVGTLPVGEPAPKADFLILVGTDKK